MSSGRCYNVAVARAFEQRALKELDGIKDFYDIEGPGIYV
jgi:hypothetical protein